MRSMFEAKIGVFQCASLPKKGQSYGKKYIEKWVREDKTVYFVKGDIMKCFPFLSPHDRGLALERRDIKKSSAILFWWPWSALLQVDMFKVNQDFLWLYFISQYLYL